MNDTMAGSGTDSACGARATDAPRASTTLSGAVGLVGVLVAIALTGWLDLSSGEDVVRRTISGYVFTDPVPFTTAVVALVVGSAAVFIGLLRQRVMTLASPSAWLLAAWALGLAAVAIFPKHDWSVGPSVSGHIHRVGSLVAFIALPIAVVLLTAHAVRRSGAWWARSALGFAIASFAYLAYLAWIIYDAGQSGTAWWQAVPLGLAERILLALEVGAVAALAAGLLVRRRFRG